MAHHRFVVFHRIFSVYGPQCMLAIACANLATKRAAATAVGLTSIFGYASAHLVRLGASDMSPSITDGTPPSRG